MSTKSSQNAIDGQNSESDSVKLKGQRQIKVRDVDQRGSRELSDFNEAEGQRTETS